MLYADVMMRALVVWALRPSQAPRAANPLPGPDRALRTGEEAVIASKHDIVTSRRHIATLCVQSSVSNARVIRPADSALFFTRTNFIGVAAKRDAATVTQWREATKMEGEITGN